MTAAEQASAPPPVLAPAGRRASLVGHLAWRAVADWSSQIISWASLLVVVRLLAPADFGLVAMCMVLYNNLRLFGDFGISTAVITLRDLSEDEIAQLNTVGVFFGTATFFIACACAWPLALFFRTPRLVPVVIVTSLSFLALGIRSVPDGLMSKEMRFNTLSLFNAIRDIVAAIVTLVLAFLGFGYWALVLGNVVSIFARTGLLLWTSPHRFAWPKLSMVKKPLFFSGHVVIAIYAWSTYSSLDNATAGRVLGQAALGLYGMAWTLSNVPLEKVVSLVTSIIPSYLASVQKDPSALKRYVANLTEALAILTFPATIGLALVARELIPVALGQKWNGMIVPAQVLCFYAAFRALVALLPKVLTAVGNAKFTMRVELTALVLMPVAFYIGSHWGLAGIAFAWVVAYPLVAAPLYWKVFQTINMRTTEYIRLIRPALDGSIAMALAVGLIKWELSPTSRILVRLVLEILAGAIAYIGAILLLHRERASIFLNLLKKLKARKPSSAS